MKVQPFGPLDEAFAAALDQDGRDVVRFLGGSPGVRASLASEPSG